MPSTLQTRKAPQPARASRVAIGGTPGRAVSPRVSVAFDPATLSRIRRLATGNGVSFGEQVRQLLTAALGAKP
jgi:hypothetical protein